MDKHRGIWIDYQKAMIVDPENDQKRLKTITANMDLTTNDHRPGRMREQFISPERKLEAKRKKLLKNYYRHVIQELDNDCDLYIFGPAEAKNELRKELGRSHKRFSNITVEVSDSMTDNQVVAQVRSFFARN